MSDLSTGGASFVNRELPDPVAGDYERCLEDPGFLNRLRDGYTGRHEVLDALYWRAHPLTTSPRGVEDPAVALASLQTLAYARPEAHDTDAARDGAERLSALSRLLEDDRVALSAALTEADAEPAEPADLGQDNTVVSPTIGSGRRQRRVNIPLIAIVVIVVGIAILQFARGASSDALDVFDRQTTAADAIPGSARFTLLGNSEAAVTRLLGTESGWSVWAVRTDSGSLCLLADHDGETASGCSSEDQFADAGVRLALHDVEGDDDAFTLVWGPTDPTLRTAN